MNDKRLGRQTVALAHRRPRWCPLPTSAGKLESQGPLADTFDEMYPDSFFGPEDLGEGGVRHAEKSPGAGAEQGRAGKCPSWIIFWRGTF